MVADRAYRKETGSIPYPDEVRSIWGTFTPADGRYGATMTASFTYHDTGESVPDTFKGVVGFNDLDGRDDQPDLLVEGVELLSGFDGAYRLKDAELAEYGTNGFSGIKRDAGDESKMNESPQILHRLTATWSGSPSHSATAPYRRRRNHISTRGAPSARRSTRAICVDAQREGRGQRDRDRAEDMVRTVLRIGDKWSIRHRRSGGYRYAGLAAGSDALSGTETSTGLRNRLVVLEYVSNPTTMPDTGGHASHLPLAIGGLAMVAAMALSVLAHRRRHNHFNPPV